MKETGLEIIELIFYNLRKLTEVFQVVEKKGGALALLTTKRLKK